MFNEYARTFKHHRVTLFRFDIKRDGNLVNTRIVDKEVYMFHFLFS